MSESPPPDTRAYPVNIDGIPPAAQSEQADPYVLQGSASTSVETITLKHGDAFLVADARGDLPESEQETGLYWRGTRFLRTCDIFLAGQPLVPLSTCGAFSRCTPTGSPRRSR
jgi:N-terminal domain of (some) glycogen debranching enzymes